MVTRHDITVWIHYDWVLRTCAAPVPATLSHYLRVFINFPCANSRLSRCIRRVFHHRAKIFSRIDGSESAPAACTATADLATAAAATTDPDLSAAK